MRLLIYAFNECTTLYCMDTIFIIFHIFIVILYVFESDTLRVFSNRKHFIFYRFTYQNRKIDVK